MMTPPPEFTVTSSGEQKPPISSQREVRQFRGEDVLQSALTADGCYDRCCYGGGGVYVSDGRGQSAADRASQVSLLLELLMEDVSVLVEAAVDASNFPAFAHPQLLTHQPDQTLVVRHQDDPALKHMTSHTEETHLRYT